MNVHKFLKYHRFFSSKKIVHSYDLANLPSLEGFPPVKIRNFGIVAHVDHGKSTLADRLLQLTKVIPKDEKKQFLDKLQVERERGITVKAQTCTMIYRDHMINLIDTPGHVDFSFEVARSLTACDGILLLVAANQGVQAQTIANFWLAFEQNQTIIPVINKIDMPTADVKGVQQQLKNLFDFDDKDVLKISAKSGLNVPSILDTIIDRIPSPKVSESNYFQAVLFDSWFLSHKGTISLIVVREGFISKGTKVRSLINDKDYEVLEVGIMHPEMIQCKALYPGQMGYLICTIKSAKEAVIGDVLFDPLKNDPSTIEPVKSFKQIKPTVYAGLYPVDASDYDDLKRSLERLCLNDRSVTLENSNSIILGQGWRVGFLGVLHMEVFGQRLNQDYDSNVILTAPGVEYKADIIDNENIRTKRHNGQARISICNAGQFPELLTDVVRFLEPMVLITMVVPNEYLASVNQMCSETRGEPKEAVSIDETKLLVKWRMPLADVVSHFFESLKGVTSGFASFDYEDDGYREIELVKVCIKINNQPVDEFSIICSHATAASKAKKLVQNLKEGIPRQQFEVTIKAVVGSSSKTIAQGVIQPYKKDFTMRLKGNFAGGRIKKKLEEQKQGKEKLKLIGRVTIPREVFTNVMKLA